MTRDRITTALLVLEIAVAVLLCGTAASRAVSLQELGISVPQSLDVEYISDEAGLDGTKYTACTGDLLELFRSNLDEKVKRWASDAARELLASARRKAFTKAYCAAINWLAKKTAYGNRLFGGGSECVLVQQSDMAEQMRQEVKAKLTSNFLVNCTTTIGYSAVATSIAGMLQTQGPGGGTAWAEDWVQSQNVRPAEQAQRRFWTQLANTNICPQFRDEVLNYFGVPQSYRDTPPAISSMGLRVNELPPFELRGQCTLPQGYDPSDSSEEAFVRNGGWEFLPTLVEPQNNLSGFISIAEAEFSAQREAMTKAAENQLVAGGGFLPIYGDKSESCALDPEGKCITDGRIKQPPGAVRDISAAEVDSYYAQLSKATGEQGLFDDVAARMQVRLLDLANAPLPLNLELGPEQNEANYTSTPPPGATPTPDPNLACPGIDPRCDCVTGDETYQGLAATSIADSIAATIQVYPNYFVAGTNQIAPGVDFTTILYAVCERIGEGGCRPHPTNNDQIVLDFGNSTLSFDILTNDGFISTTGGTPIAACESGVQ